MASKKPVGLVLHGLALLVAVGGFYVFSGKQDFRLKTSPSSSTKTSQSVSSTASSSTEAGLPAVTADDWELILVNRDHPTEELPIELGYVEGVPVDSRIVEATSQFLAAVYELDPDPLQGLYSGYRSLDEQQVLFDTRVAEAMAAGQTEEEAIATVSATVMPAGSSEHHTGLAIDLMRLSDRALEIATMAPEYGFVLRYPEDKVPQTGIAHEDWHYRYVGVASAKYMTEHQLSLEEYIALLREAAR